MTGSKRRTMLLAASLMAVVASAPADARRGGSFGSRGSRTYTAPRATRIAPGYVPGVSRSMTAPSRYAGAASVPYPNTRPRFGFGSGLLAGVVTGGLIGSLFGHGMGGYGSYGAGGGGGLLALLIQLALIGGVIWLALRLFRGSRGAPAAQPSFSAAVSQSAYAAPAPFGGSSPDPDAVAIDSADQAAFETLLGELQDAFDHEDYARLRAITTPEIMSYLAEELSDNATHGRRNDVTRTRLIDAEVSEAWREGDTDYATIAMRYESIDVMRDRVSGAVLSGDPSTPTTTVELWTFVRPGGPRADWKVSAIQES